MTWICSALRDCLCYLKIFCRETTLHGLNHVVAPKRHWLERLVWILIFLSSTIYSCFIIGDSLHRFESNPIIVSIEKDYQNWKIPLSANTICFKEKMSESKARHYIEKTWKVTKGSSEYDYYLNFTHAVANLGLLNLDPFKRFANDSNLSNINLIEMATAVKYDNTILERDDEFSYGAARVDLYNVWDYSVTPANVSVLEMGLCESVLSPAVSALSAEIVPKIWNYTRGTASVYYCNKMGQMCRGWRHMDKGLELDSYQYSPYDIPHILTRVGNISGEAKELSETFSEEAITASPRIREMTPKKRRCYFYDEKVYDHVPFYSMNLCRTECRRNHIFRLCHCVPPFYHRPRNQPVCDIKGLVCVAEHIKEIIDEAKLGRKKCPCLPTCETHSYPLVDRQISWNRGLRSVQWSIVQFSSTHYRREVIFEFSDLLVNFGGTAALFLGCSLLSAVELAYFFTVRLYKFMIRKVEEGSGRLRKTSKGSPDQALHADNLTKRLKLITLRTDTFITR